MSLSDAVQQGNQALLEMARDTMLHKEPALLSRTVVDSASDTTAPTADMTSTASTTSEARSEQQTGNNNASSGSSSSSSATVGKTYARSPLSAAHSVAFWGRFRASSRVRSYLLET